MIQMSAQPQGEDALLQIASDLSHVSVRSVTRAGGGGNSRIYKVETEKGPYALKMYPTMENDARDRLGVEKKALQFFERHGIDCTPRWINSMPGYALLSWVEGELANPPTAKELDQAIAFLGDMRRLSLLPDASAMPAASEACVSGTEILAQLQKRLVRLQEIAPREPMLGGFFEREFMPYFDASVAAAEAAYAKAGLSLDVPLSAKCLIPADFGFHNAMRGPEGQLTFIDFEYFGWDDPVKLVADFLLHPGMTLTAGTRMHFHARMQEIFAQDAHFGLRLRVFMPLFALRWALILLNEFLPERWSGRAFAQGNDAWEAAKKRQLAKASQMLKNTMNEEYHA